VSYFGLYEIGSSSLTQIAAPQDILDKRLANGKYGRRLITTRGQVLIFSGIQLNWLDTTGMHPIRHVAGAFEAVTDAAGNNLVYVEAPVGELHWIANLVDEDLGLVGSAPAMTEDGSTLVFLASDGSLQIYDRASRGAHRLENDMFLEFTLGGNAAFAVTSDDRLVRIDLATGDVATWLDPLPDIQSVDAPVIGFPCNTVCYSLTDPGLAIAGGMILVLRGMYLDQPGWRARIGAADTALNPISSGVASLQVPIASPVSNSTLTIFNPSSPLTFSRKVDVLDTVIACFGVLHQDFSSPVVNENPALPAEIVHVFLTGLHGVEAIPDGVPNPVDRLIPVADPPALVDPGAADIVFFGLAPSLIGIQQLDLQVHHPSQTDLLHGFGCSSIPVAMSGGLS
jgi:hypothetical protein